MKNLKDFKTFVNENLNLDDKSNYNNMIDYTSLTEKETEQDIISLCEKAKILGTKSVCVYPKWVKTAKECLKDSNVLVCTVISFPKGENTISEKVSETKKAISDGADEIDMVLNWKKLKTIENITDNLEKLKVQTELTSEVRSLVEICNKSVNKFGDKVILKVIVESGELTLNETKLATKICLDANADFIKTSTGKVAIGAELDKVKMMFDTIKSQEKPLMIKASGGIRTMDDIIKFEPFVDRFGMGYASVDQINGLDSKSTGNY